MDELLQPGASLLCVAGEQAGMRFMLRSTPTRIGRDRRCDMIFEGEEAGVVSSVHAEIYLEAGSWRIRDLGSTNGTLVGGVRIEDVALQPGTRLRFGTSGPEFIFEISAETTDLDRTLVAPATTARGGDRAPDPNDQLAEAVRKARRLRSSGAHGHTMVLMRKAFQSALRDSHRRWRLVVISLVATIILIGGLSLWRIRTLGLASSDIDQQILRIQDDLERGDLDDAEIQALVERLDDYQSQAIRIQDSLFYRFGLEGRERAFVERELNALLTEFGAEQFSVPPEFADQVRRFVDRYRTTDRTGIESTVGRYRADFARMREIFTEHNLPPDLVYMVLVESAFDQESRSAIGAAGLWQFTYTTARAYGLQIDGEVDERHDLEKSTQAASRYLRELILEFGSGSSVMLALAAYNSGPQRVRQAVRRVEDPIEQRNFWYLHRERALPLETRQFVPKILAAIIIGRNLERFGF